MSTIYFNGEIYTGNTAQPWAEAIWVSDGRIRAVGTARDLRDLSGGAEQVDLQGRMVMPGLHDAHLHLLFSGLKFKYEARLSPGADAEQIVEDLRNCQCSGPTDRHGNQWIIGGEFMPANFTHGVDNHHLNEAFPETPVFLYDYSIHHGLANARALELAGLESGQPQETPGGGCLRDSTTGQLTGELVEQATWPVQSAIPDYTEDVYLDAVNWAVQQCHQYGITSVQEASASPQALAAFKTLDSRNQLKVRVAAHLVWREEGFGMATAAELEAVIADRHAWASPHVDTSFIKIWLDGAPLPPHCTQSDLLEDEIDESKILVPQSELIEALAKFDADGLQVKIHCAGEGAIRAALDAIEQVRKRNGAGGPSHELAHAGFISEADYPRLAKLDVIAEMSPALWHIPEFGLQDGFRFKSVLSHHAKLTVGSDWIVLPSPNLFPGLQGMLEHGPHSVDLATALEAVTLAGARAVGKEDIQGTLEAGKSADFIVLDRNLFKIPISDIGATRVEMTVFEGDVVYRSEPTISENFGAAAGLSSAASPEQEYRTT